jgi:hypothetical protein
MEDPATLGSLLFDIQRLEPPISLRVADCLPDQAMSSPPAEPLALEERRRLGVHGWPVL